MSKTVLFFSCEPGGAEELAPVIKTVRDKTFHNIITLAYGHGYDRFVARGIDATRIEPVQRGDYVLFDTYSPAFFITSATSLPQRDMSEKYLWEMARVREVPSLAFLDQWQNYAIRFSGIRPEERLKYLPDHIACPDEVCVKEMIAEGIDQTRPLVFGHPYLAGVAEEYARMDQEAVRAHPALSSLKPGATTILFASEPIEEHFGHERGYTQYTALTALIGNLKKMSAPVNLLIKLHPKDDPGKFYSIAASYEPCVLISAELSPIQTLAAVDIVSGMTSILLIEAFLVGKPVFSLQPGLKGKDLFILSRYDYVPRIEQINFDPLKVGRRNDNRAAVFSVAFRKEEFLKFIGRQLDKSCWTPGSLK